MDKWIDVYNSFTLMEKLFIFVLLGLMFYWFYSYYAHRTHLARLRRTIDHLSARERQSDARYEDLLRRFHALEMSVNKMHQRIDFALPQDEFFTPRRREAGAPMVPPGQGRDPRSA